MIPVAEVLLLCSVPSLTVGILLYGENPKHAINRLLLLFSVVLFYWGFTQFEYMTANDVQTAQLWMRIHAFWYLLPALALDFAIVYTNLRVRRLLRCLFVYGPAAFLSLFEIVAISYHPEMMPWGWDYAYSGYFAYVELLWTVLPTVVALYMLLRKYWSAESQNERIGVGYIFLGFSLPIIMGISTTVLQVLISINVPDLTAPSAAIGFLLVWYGVVRHGNYILMANAAADDILSTMADALFLANCAGEVIVSNGAASKLFEYETSELTGRGLSTLACAPSSIEAFLGDPSTIFESNFKTKKGRTIAVSLSKSAILTKLGDPMGHVIICHDITARKQTEQALSESERRFRELTDLLPEMVWEIDTEGKLTFLNRAGLDFTGYDEDDLRKGLNLFQLTAPESRALLTERARRIMNGERSVRSESAFVRKDGSRFPATIHASRVVKDGRPVGLRGVVVDITERKRIEDSLRESEARFRELADLLPQIVFETDEKGVLTFFNHFGLSSLGYTEEDLRNGFDAFQAFPPEDARRAMESMRRVMDGGQMTPNEYTLLRKDGTSFPIIIYSSAIIREGRPVGLRGIIIDMTERKEMEQRLLKAEHLAAIGETASMVAHDLRNPLQGITGAASVLRGEALTVDEKNRMLRVIGSSVEYAQATVRDLLDYSREIYLQLVEVSPRSMSQSALQAVRVPGNVEVLDMSQEQPAISVDPDRMKRVFINLIENAIDAMPTGGTITITTKESDGHLEITISDTGTGIPEKIMENLWKPMQTTKAKGLGLGLSIVKRIVEAHGGQISAKAKSGEGTTFTIRLPIKDANIAQTV
jgi:PAS domain S-box-containing protein